jgi:diguanylate cyclase (GGDEF)-like protein
MTSGTRTARTLLGVLSLIWMAFAVHVTLRAGGHGLDAAFNDVVLNAVVIGAASIILLRAAAGRTERRAWAIVGAGALLWSLGGVFHQMRPTPFPSPADAFHLCFYPAAYVALVMLIRSRLHQLRPGLLLDGLLVGLTAATVVAAVALGPIVANDGATFSTVATNLAYPVGDLILLVVVVAALGVNGWRPSAGWLLIAGSMVVAAAADVAVHYEQARASYVPGTWLDALWPAALIMLAAASWVPGRVQPRGPTDGRRMYLITTAAELVSVSVLVYATQRHVYVVAVALAGIVMVVAAGRMLLMLRENQRMLATSQTDALTDALTGLANRRRLGEDLAAAAQMASEDEPLLVVFYDLDGFKQYNDTFGHLAGDALLGRLGRRLAAAVEGRGRAYRLGGDEFCTLLWAGPDGDEKLLEATVDALGEQGSGFNVRTSHGAVAMPSEATEVSQALTLADQRLYLHKEGRPGSPKQQLRDVLLQAFRERQPALQRDPHSVRELSGQVARRLGVGPEELDVLARAAELHDVGKIAVPDAILEKPDPLNADETDFMRRHPILGQRILAAAPALRPVAELIRSTHERFDGGGYPDGLAGEQIPLGARIIAVCDAFDAIVSGRPYREPLGRDEAIRRLVEGAGTQFDPSVVGAVLQVLAAAGSERPRAPHDARRKIDASLPA